MCYAMSFLQLSQQRKSTPMSRTPARRRLVQYATTDRHRLQNNKTSAKYTIMTSSSVGEAPSLLAHTTVLLGQSEEVLQRGKLICEPWTGSTHFLQNVLKVFDHQPILFTGFYALEGILEDGIVVCPR